MASDHAKISYVKSGFRFIGYAFMVCTYHQHPCIAAAGAFLFIAEIIGVIEEIGH